MNILLFEKKELHGDILVLSDRRAEHIRHVLGLEPGDSLKAGMINGKMGTATIVGMENREIVMEVFLTAYPSEEPWLELVLALPRPIMLQRILKQATVLGVRRFHLIRTNRVQKSYFQSNLLQPEKMREVLVQGLEQTVDTRLPEVRLHNRFMPFVEDVLPSLQPSCRLLAHPDAPASLLDCYRDDRVSGDLLLAVGPEGGWSRHEMEQFTGQGFCSFSIGRRILHVDTAVVALLAQFRLIHEISGQGKNLPGGEGIAG